MLQDCWLQNDGAGASRDVVLNDREVSKKPDSIIDAILATVVFVAGRLTFRSVLKGAISAALKDLSVVEYDKTADVLALLNKVDSENLFCTSHFTAQD